ncbi:MAG: fumarylacetoacetate hydrolase family protein [Actinomycetota bacterium]
MAFRLANRAGRAVLLDGDGWHDLAAASDGAFSGDPMEAVRRHAELHAVDLTGRAPDGSVADAEFDAPVPTPRSVFAIGLNYADHVGESSMEVPENPLVFTKFPSCLAGPTADVVLNSDAGDYEAELVIVIGVGGRDIPAESAWDHVMGLTIGQDISDRALQFAAKPPHFDLGKSRDTYGPCGPAVVSTDLVADPADLAITCDVNGERRQTGNTGQLIFDVPTLIAYISSVLTLEVGDLVFTGTPDGVGAAQLNFLSPGDVIETSIDGLGTMRNVCV